MLLLLQLHGRFHKINDKTRIGYYTQLRNTFEIFLYL